MAPYQETEAARLSTYQTSFLSSCKKKKAMIGALHMMYFLAREEMFS
jgi:hypothetical protein